MNLFQAFRPLLSDFLSTIVFAILYAATHDIYLAVGAGMAVGVAQIVIARVRKQKIDVMQWASLALVVVLGSATLITADPRFVMVKPSIGGVAIGSVMLRRGWQNRYLPPIVTENMSAAVLIAWGYIWAALIFALAAVNLVIAFMFTSYWALYISFVPLSLQLGLFLIQYVTIRGAARKTIRARMASGQAAAAE
ncbi:MAG: septation protein IspZ [Proteobacteria bacterium]|nr:septation protein IspZ [Pseudomonadota bacterium]